MQCFLDMEISSCLSETISILDRSVFNINMYNVENVQPPLCFYPERGASKPLCIYMDQEMISPPVKPFSHL